MKIRIKAFASIKDIWGFSEREIDVQKGISVGDTVNFISENFGELNNLRDILFFAVNEEYCNEEMILNEDDILAIFPPVTGG